MTATKKRILFVDDEPAILAGLQNLLYKDRKRWDMVFALGGERALVELNTAPFDVVVSDMRMPGIDGAALLNRVKDEWPATVRIMLSGHADREAIVRALPALHQLLSKPCDAGTLRSTLERSLEGTNVDHDGRIRALIGGLDKLPTPPDVFFELSRLLQSSTTSVTDVASVVIRDPGLAAKLLQLVNSAYFGAGQATTSIQQAVALLGMDRLRYIALTASVFSASSPAADSEFSLEDAQQDAMHSARIAEKIAPPELRDAAFAATLLHDIGRVVLAFARSGEYQLYLRRRRLGEDGLALELELFGVSHADVGARLLAIWGLPLTLVDAVQFHHDPGSAPEASRTVAALVHCADAICHARSAPRLDMASLERAGCAQLVPGWCELAERLR